MYKTILFFLTSMLLSGAIGAQKRGYEQTLRGTVRDADTQQALEGVNVILDPGQNKIITVTDDNGQFVFENVSVGRHDVAAVRLGYHPLFRNNVSVGTGHQTVLTLDMTVQIIETEEVVVEGSNNRLNADNEMAVVSARRFSVEETERYAGSLGDPSRMAANFAGVMSVSDQRNDIIIRGNSPSGLLWRLEGIEIPNPNHFAAMGTTGGPVSMLNNNLLTNSDFYSGAFPAEYGNAVSGVFDLNMRKGNNQAYEHTAQIGFNGFELGTEGPFTKKSKASYLANYRYSTYGVMNRLGFNDGTGSALPEYQDLTFHLNFPLQKGRISLIGLGGKSDIELLSDDTEASSYDVVGADTYFGSETGVLGLSHVHYLSEKSKLHTTLSAQSFRTYTILDSVADDDSRYLYYHNDLRETKYSINTKFYSRINTKNIFSGGLTYDYFDIGFIDSVKVSGEDRFERNTDMQGDFSLLRAYAEWKHRFTDNLSFYTGVHGMYLALNDHYAIEPRAGINWDFWDKQRLSLGLGMHSQVPNHLSFFLLNPQDDGTVLYSNEHLGFLKSDQIVLAYEIYPHRDLRIKTELYYQSLSEVPVSEEFEWYSLLNEGAGFATGLPDSMVNNGSGTNYGIELTAEKMFHKNYYFLVTASLYESNYKGYDGIERNTVFNGNFVFNLLGGYEFKTGSNSLLAFDLRGVWAGGQRIMPLDEQASMAEGEAVYIFEEAFEERYDDYMKLDARISFKLNYAKYSHEWGLDLQNVTNEKNIFRRAYNPTTNEIQTDYQNGFYPMMLYRFRF